MIGLQTNRENGSGTTRENNGGGKRTMGGIKIQNNNSNLKRRQVC